MSVHIQWDLLRRGLFEQGIALMDQSFNENPTPSTLVTLGLGYLWVGEYDEVCKLFQSWMDKYEVTADAYFALIGVAQWCLEDVIAACRSWKSGLSAQYTDMAGGVQCPLLLWTASALKRNERLQREVVAILGDRVLSDKSRHWPGPLAQFVIGEIDERALLERSRIGFNANTRLSRKTPLRREWSIEFYKHVREFEGGRLSSYGFQKKLRELVNTSDDVWSDEKDFVQLVRPPEFYIARYEAGLCR